MQDGQNRGAPRLAEAIPLLVRGDGITTDLEDVIKPKGISLEDDLGDACLAGESMIDTARGLVPIRKVTISDYVLTRKGYRRVLWSGQTGIKQVINFGSLQVTPNHPIFANGHFVIRSSMGENPCLLIRKKSYLKGLSTAVMWSRSADICERTFVEGRMKRIHSFTLKFIKAFMVKFPRVFTYITKTSILATTSPRTWWQSLSRNIVAYTGPLKPVLVAGSNSSQPTNPSSMSTIPIDYTAPSGARFLQKNANTVESNFVNLKEEWGVRDSVPTSASQHGEGRKGLTWWQAFVSTVATTFPSIASSLFGFVQGRARIPVHYGALLSPRPVFNLSVEGEEEYFANGILVHNCRYAVAGVLLDPEDKPAQQVKREKLDAIKDPLARQIVGYKEYLKEQKEAQGMTGPPGIIIPTWQRRVKPQ